MTNNRKGNAHRNMIEKRAERESCYKKKSTTLTVEQRDDTQSKKVGKKRENTRTRVRK